MAPLYGGAFFVEKSCCFILPMGFSEPLERKVFDERLSALLYHLVFSEEVTTYYFIYDEEAEFAANRILEGIRPYAPSLRRVLIFPRGQEMRFGYYFMGENRFEEKEATEQELFEDREELYRSLIERSDVVVFALRQESDYAERRHLRRAESEGKRVIDLSHVDTLPEWFKRPSGEETQV